MTSLLDSPVLAAANPATHLKCRNCSATYELAAVHVCMACFAPLEIGYDEERLQRVTRESIEAGPQQPLALRRTAARRSRRGHPRQPRAPAGPRCAAPTGWPPHSG